MIASIEKLLGDVDSFLERRVSVSGHLLIGENDRPFLAADYESYKQGNRLPVADGKQIADYLLRTLPAYGGGDVIYDEDAIVVGMILKRTDRYEMTDLRSCEIVRDGVAYMVPLRVEHDTADA